MAAENDPLDRLVDAVLGRMEATTPPPDDVWHFIDWSALWNEDADDAQWLAEPIIAAASGHAWYAPAKAGKSFVLLQVCAALATGREVFGGIKPVRARVLYLDYEMTRRDVHDRLEQYGYGPDCDLSWLHYAMLPSLPELNSPEGGKYLLEMAKRLGVALVVIDTTSRALDYGSRDEQSSKPYQEFYKWCGMHLKAAGIAWMRVAHAGKDKEKGQRGSSAQNDDVDVVWRLDRTQGGVKLTATHRRMGWVPEVVELVEVRDEVAGTWLHNLAPESMPSYPAGTGECAKALDELGVALDATVKAAMTAMKEADRSPRHKQIVGAAQRFRRTETERRMLMESARTASRTVQIGMNAEPLDDGTRTTSMNHARTARTDGSGPNANHHPPIKGGGSRDLDSDHPEDRLV